MNHFKRKRSGRQIIKKIYIYTEGECTEVNYFEDFINDVKQERRSNDIAFVIKGTGRSNLSLVEFAKSEIAKIKDFNKNDDDIWVVFDEDTVGDGKFDNALSMAESCNINVAYANECFELWILLHYEYIGSDIGRKNYYKRLSSIFSLNYEKKGKNIKNIFNQIKDKQPIAISRAEKLLLLAEYQGKPRSKCKPSTTVHLLVEELNKLRKN